MNNAEQTRRDFLKFVTAAGATAALVPTVRAAAPAEYGPGAFKVPALDKVRVGFIGVGARGGSHLSQMMTLDGVEVIAIADNHAPTLNAAVARVEKAGRP